MADEKWQKVREIFDAAVCCKPEERKSYIKKACGSDKTLLAEVESLLSSLDSAESFLETPAVAKVADIIEAETKKLEMGKHFAHYEIIEQIGAGGMGEVYLAKDKKLDRKVAIKVLNKQFSQHESNLQRFTREAKAASALNHPNILVIHEIGEAESEHYIVSEYVEGKTLREIIRQSRLRLSDILDISIQIANALAAAHEAHLVHRDIKPENIMIRPDGFVKVLDFGLAKLVEQKNQSIIALEDKTVQQNQTAKGVILGTVNYMSPEQAKGERVDERTDIFSLGGVFYEMLAGQTPFAGDSPSETFANLINIEPQPLSRFAANIPNELQKIVSKTLRKNSDKRYQTIKELVFDLKKLQKRLDFEAETERLETPEKSHGKQPNKSIGLILDSAIIKSGKRRQNKTKTQTPPPNNLSLQTARLIGREKEIAKIIELLKIDDVQLLTLTGVGGTGKTTLAQAIAREILMDFKDGVFFVELAAVTNSELVASTIAQTLEVKETGGKPILEVLKDFLREQHLLLVIDNFEQVLSAAPVLSELLKNSSDLKILVTSRVRLNLSKDCEFVVPPLAVPESAVQVSLAELSENESVRLFVERAAAARPNFALSEENAPSVAEICARLDGLPLAIELASARVRIISPQSILERLENRLKLLTGGAKDLPARQQTVRSTVEWSYELLDENEKILFRRLAVFAGGFTFEAAEKVCGNVQNPTAKSALSFSEKEHPKTCTPNIDVLDGITSLLNSSLIIQKEQTDGEPRFRMLEVVREYALETLEASGEAEAMRRSHAAYFLALAEEAEPHLQRMQDVKWLNRMEEEHDNLRAALQWSLEKDRETAARLAASLRHLWALHSHLAEGCRWLKTALDFSSNKAPTISRLKLLNGLALLSLLQGDYEMSQTAYKEGLAAGKMTNDLYQIAFSNNGLGMIALRQGDYTAARKHYEEGLAINCELDDISGIGRTLNSLGNLALLESDTTSARLFLEKSLKIFRQLGDKNNMTSVLTNLGAVAFGKGDFAEAYAHYIESLMLARELGNRSEVSDCLDGFASLAINRGDTKLATYLSGAAEQVRELVSYEIQPFERRFRDTYLAELKTKLDEADFADFYEKGRKLKLEEAISLALETV